MPVITLPDGSQHDFARPVTVQQVAQQIGPGLARSTVAGCVDGRLVDACFMIERDSALRIITPRDAEGLEIIRHSCAHLFGHALKQLYPAARMVIGPVIEDGFYYDVDHEQSFAPGDLERIEQRMQELAQRDYEVIHRKLPRDEVLRIFRERGEDYKIRLVEEMPKEQELGLYYHEEYIDMCRGPHVPNTRFLRAFKLTHVSGAYWRGDSRNEMLQRIYGTAWPDHKQLKSWLKQREEAEKRSHRRLGSRLRLFHTQEEAPGMIFWHPRGWTLYRQIEDYIRALQRRNHYQEIRTPYLLDRSLWEKSGHWEKFREQMFTVASEHRDYAIKPLNCPGHVQVFRQGVKSYRELPLRLAEFGCCHRSEPSGTLLGLMRVRAFTQDDGHIFCTEEQVQGEVQSFIQQVFSAYRDFGFDDVQVQFSSRPEQRVGSDQVWDQAEQALRQALQTMELDWEEVPGAGAFYGPKLEFSLRDCLGRTWQCGTIQLDFSLPGRLGAEYVTADDQRRPPVMLHRAILGSFERFIGILIEHYAGAFPTWLAPVMAVVLNITDQQSDYAREVAGRLCEQGLRVEADLRNEKIGHKIREHSQQRIPYLLVVGDREKAAGKVSVRDRLGRDLGVMDEQRFAAFLSHELTSRGSPEQSAKLDT